MTTHLTKIWWDENKHKLVEQAIPEVEIYKREWVGLTNDELWDLWNSYIEEPFPEWFVDFKKAYEVIEAKLKEKNT